MTCTDLGFDDYGTLRVNKSADLEETFVFPTTYDFTGYTGSFQIRATESASSALLTVTATATANGSIIIFDDNLITLRLKKADLTTLPNNGTDADDPYEAVYQFVTTDTDSLTSELIAGTLIAEKGVVR
jgi:hypothetical protein